jgi:glyoxylase-like metal-dependent hydrolase (beta-lactamase superfamily II)
MNSLPAIERFQSNNGVRIYRIPLEVFTNGFIGYAYMVLDAGLPTLVDCGSGFGRSNQDLLDGISALRTDFGERLDLSDIKHILVTHGHKDHFGGLERAGVPAEPRQIMIDMYGFAKKHVRSVNVDFTLDEDVAFEGMQFVHTPGHCPGQVCIILGDVMLSADHILSRTTPHQAPESITNYTGLGHYRDSLRKVEKLDGIALALGGHEDPVRDVYGRIHEIQQSHERKLNRILDIIKQIGQPCTIYEITEVMYPGKTGYDTLLAIYLYQHGYLSVANLDEVELEDNPALRYLAV